MAHFTNIIPRIEDEDYDLLFPRLSVNGNLPGAFLILDTTELPLIRWTIFVSKNNRTINLLWLFALQDMDELDSWSWGG